MRARNVYVQAIGPDLLADPPRLEWELHLSDPEETGAVVVLEGSLEALCELAEALLIQIGREVERQAQGAP